MVRINTSRTNIYIDWANLHKASEMYGFCIDYSKLFTWLEQKFKFQYVYVFIGFLEDNIQLYFDLQEIGYNLVFKEITLNSKGEVKGNCDAEMVLKITRDFYEKCFDTCVLISSDGDFGCVASFLKENHAIKCIASPYGDRCSIILRRIELPIVDMPDHLHKFSEKVAPKRKGPR